jgi:hypothetical protein
MKIVAYTILNGKAVKSAYLDPSDRDAALEAHPDKAILTPGEQAIDVQAAYDNATSKLDGIDKLVLFGITEKTRKALATGK